MRVQNNNLRNTRSHVDESKRRDLKRLAAFACALVLGTTLVSAGCKTTGSEKESKTVDDFLAAKKPQW